MPKLGRVGPEVRRLKVDKGLTIYRRVKTPVWWMDISIPGMQRVRASTHEEDSFHATEIARKKRRNLLQKSRGFPIEELAPPTADPPPRTFRTLGDVLTAYRDYLLGDREQRDGRTDRPLDSARVNAGIIQNYLLPWWGPKTLESIQDSDIGDWKKWREEQVAPLTVTMTRGEKTTSYERLRAVPSPTTLKRERGVLLMALKYARRMPWFDQKRRPTIGQLWWPAAIRTRSERRPAFAKSQKTALLAALRKRQATWRQKVFEGFVRVMFASGLRTGEAHVLQWRDLREIEHSDFKTMSIHVRAKEAGAKKTGARKVVALPEIIDAVESLRTLHAQKGWRTDRDGYLFVSENGIRVDQFDDDFNSIVAALKLDPIGHDGRFSLYSCRHTYATLLLDSGRDAYHIAKNMGTSIRMIAAHYGQTDLERNPGLVIPDDVKTAT